MYDTPVLLNGGTPIRVTTKYFDERCWIERGIYPATKQPYIALIDRNRYLLMKATVAVTGYTLEPNHCFIKNYSENEGIEAPLVKAGVIKLTGEYYQWFNVAEIVME